MRLAVAMTVAIISALTVALILKAFDATLWAMAGFAMVAADVAFARSYIVSASE